MNTLEKFFINEDATLIEALSQLDEIAKKVLYVVRDNKLVATVTDGDIRRIILSKGLLDVKVKEFANYKPKFLMQKDTLYAKTYMRDHNILSVPIINEKRKIIAIEFLTEDEIITEKINLPIVMMAGGLGTRLYPYTKILPKPLIPIGDIPISEHIINNFYKYGCREFHLIVNHKKNMIKAYYNEINKDYEVNFENEEIPLGTGGGLSLLKGKIDSTFILTNCDILVQEDFSSIYKYHKEKNNLITMVCSLKNIKIPYGVIELNKNGEIENMKEKPEFSFLTNTGVYIVESKIIEELESNKKIGFPDVIQKYKDSGEKIGVYPISEKSWLDMGQLDEMEKMRERLSL